MTTLAFHTSAPPDPPTLGVTRFGARYDTTVACGYRRCGRGQVDPARERLSRRSYQCEPTGREG